MTIAPLALKSELTTDPAHYGYAAIPNDDQVASLLNQVNATTLTTALTNGQAGIVALAVAALPFAAAAGATFELVSGGNTQIVTLSAAAAAGATSLSVVSFTANAAYPIGAAVYREAVTVTTISTGQLQNAVVASEYTALTAGLQNLWQAIILSGGGRIDISQSGIRSQIGAIWGAGTTTRANLLALQLRAGSRAETLGGVGTSVNGADVGTALTS